MLARNARSMGRSQEAQELSSSGTPGTEPQDFGPRSLVPVRSSSASSPVQIWTTEVYIHRLSSIVSCTKPLFTYIYMCLKCFTNVHFYQCNIPPTSPWHHSSVQHPQSSLSSPHQHFLSKSPHPQDAEKLCNHISWWRYNISANISTPHLVKELGDIVNLVVYNRPNWFVGSPSYIVLLHFFQPKHLHFASHPQMAWSLWNKKLCTECHV